MSSGKAEDDVSGGPLDPHEVKIARKKEIQCLWDRNVCEHATGREARTQTGRNQSASNGSIKTRAPLSSHAIVHVWYARKCATRSFLGNGGFASFGVARQEDVPQVADHQLISIADVS